MASNFIKWTKKDYQDLQRAARAFNRKIKVLEKYDLVDYDLPDKVVYKDLKKDILTRAQLNQTLTSLAAFQKSKALDEVKLQSGEIISRWQSTELSKRAPLAIEKIKADLAEEIANEENRTSFRGLVNERIDRLQQTLNTLENYDKKTGDALKYAIDRITKIGNIDYSLKKAQTFRDNFMYALKEGARNFKNYNLLKKELESIKDPREFYDRLKNSDTFMDLFLWYKEGEGLTYGAFKDNEEAFNTALVNDFGINITE